MKTYTESSLKSEGWYFFYPNTKFGGSPRFVYVDQGAIVSGHLKSEMHDGWYVGPIPVPEPADTLEE